MKSCRYGNANMVSFYFLILIPLITATRRFDGPSHRSHIMEGDKPILRMSPNADHAESSSDEGRQTTPPPKSKVSALVNDLGLFAKWLVEHFSYDVVPLGRKNNNVARDGGKPILRMPPENTSDSDSDGRTRRIKCDDKCHGINEDNDKVGSKIDITEPQPLTKNPVTPPVELAEEPPVDQPVGPSMDPPVEPAVEPSVESQNSDRALRTKHKNKKHKEEDLNPEWVKDLKEYIKDLTTRYGQQEVLEHAKPVIVSLEKTHNMKIKDIDVDEYGEIHITYIERGKGKKTARKRKKS